MFIYLQIVKITASLDAKGVQSHLFAPSHTILKTHVWCVTHQLLSVFQAFQAAVTY